MSKISPVYELATALHQALYEDTENQARSLIVPGEVRADISEPYKTKRLTAIGTIDGRRVYQHLSQSQRNGHFYLSTVFTVPGGEVRLLRITEETPVEELTVLEETLFMKAVKKQKNTSLG